MSERETQIAEMSFQLTYAFEQAQACGRQMQLCKNQMQKTQITINEVEKNPSKMFRACGRMFVIAVSAQLSKDLKGDMDRLLGEQKRVDEMNKSFEAKKQILTPCGRTARSMRCSRR